MTITDQLKPGPELDRRVAEAVGWPWDPDGESAIEDRGGGRSQRRYPSRRNADAIAALEATGAGFCLLQVDGEVTCGLGYYVGQNSWAEAADRFRVTEVASTIPLAICAAILAWKEAKTT